MARTTPSGQQIFDGSIQYIDIQNVTSQRLVGRYAASLGLMQEISIGSGLTLDTSTGILTASGAAGVSTVTTANSARITVGGTGTNPTVDISSTYVGQGTITTLGTITSGIWNGTTIAIGNGGSGQTSAQAALNAFVGAVTTGQYLRGNGTNIILSTFQSADIPTTSITVAQLNASGTPSSTTYLRGDGTWSTPAGGGSNLTVTTVTTTTTLSTSVNQVILADTTSGIFTITLPTAVSNSGLVYTIKKINTGNTLTIATTSSQTIDGGTTASITVRYTSIDLISDGANWYVI